MAFCDSDGSDFVPNCSVCVDHGGTIKSADGYCAGCMKYICQDCFKLHRIFEELRNHKFIEKGRMPERNISLDTIDETCECKKENHKVEYYCEGHQKLLCTICIISAHKDCKYLVLSECSKNKDRSEEYSKIQKELDDAEQLFETNKAKSETNRERCVKSFEEVFTKLRSLKERLQETLDAVTELEKKAISTMKEHVERFQDIEQSNTTAVINIRSKRQDLSSLQNMSLWRRLFVAVERSKSFLKGLARHMADINMANTQQSYVFIPNEFLETALTKFLDVGKVIKHETSTVSSNTDMISVHQQYPEFVFPKCIETSDESIIVIDFVSKTLKRKDKDGKIYHIKLSSGPWDIASVSDSKVVVTQPNEEKVSFVKFDSASLRISGEINLNCRCEIIAFANNVIYVASSKPPAIVIYDVSKSKETQRIDLNNNGQLLFQQPAYIDVNPEKHLFCLSDRKSNKVFLFNWSGSLSRVFESDDMKLPLDVSFQKNNIVVMGYESRSINIISLDEGDRNPISTRFIENVQAGRVLSDTEFSTNECFGFCIANYLSLICKNKTK